MSLRGIKIKYAMQLCNQNAIAIVPVISTNDSSDYWFKAVINYDKRGERVLVYSDKYEVILLHLLKHKKEYGLKLVK